MSATLDVSNRSGARPAAGFVLDAVRPGAVTEYVLVTPVRDEAATIERTITSVLAQTILPTEWIIVDDGSIDGTNAIVNRYALQHPWIRVLQRPRQSGRSFASVVHCTEAGVRYVATQSYGFIGLLDADVEFQADYFEELMRQFDRKPQLGLAGGVVFDVGTRKRLPRNRIDVPGAVQFYRRECLERLGGLCAVPEGGWDALSCAMARMVGFETELVTGLIVCHLKPRNSAAGGWLRRKWQMGARDYATGYHPLFEVVKCASRISEYPPVIGSLVWWASYCVAAALQRGSVVPPKVVAHLRREQLQRLRQLVLRSPNPSA